VDPKKLKTWVPFLLSLAAAALLISAGAQPPESDVAGAASDLCRPRAAVC